jgi:hypothetical protein
MDHLDSVSLRRASQRFWDHLQMPEDRAPRRPGHLRAPAAAVAVSAALVMAVAGCTKSAAPSPGPSSAPSSTASAVITAAASPARAAKPAFPPATLAAFQAFAAVGDASEVTQVGFVNNGAPSCPEPTYYVTIPSSLGVRAVEADLSAFFVQKNGFASNACGGAVVFAYHSLSDYNANKGNAFTAGRVIVETNSPGPPYNLEVDAGSALSPAGSFNFNF